MVIHRALTMKALAASIIEAAELMGSMGRVASALDNSMMESFFGMMQRELLDR